MVFAFDLDGVIYAGDRLLPFAAESVAMVRSLGHEAYFISNNSRQTSVEIAGRLQTMGVDAAPDQVVCATEVAGRVVGGLDGSHETALVIGSSTLGNVIGGTGLRVLSSGDNEPADVVVIGMDFGINYQKLAAAHRALGRKDAKFIAVNNDVTYASDGGSVPGCGAVVSAIAASSGRKPDVVVGKPEPHMFQRVLELARADAAELIVIGDSLYADVGGAHAIGAKAALALTGVDGRHDVDRASPEHKPDWIIETLAEMPFDAMAEPRDAATQGTES